uniref:Uncharacterized protein n=1 Tax=Arundo donax TaxID=35708 RepID=A0A0A9H320_ARUDO
MTEIIPLEKDNCRILVLLAPCLSVWEVRSYNACYQSNFVAISELLLYLSLVKALTNKSLKELLLGSQQLDQSLAAHWK